MIKTIPLLFFLVLMIGCGFQKKESYLIQNDAHGVSFRVPLNWKSVPAQMSSTLVMLYEQTGTLATCNLSAFAKKTHSEIDKTVIEEMLNSISKSNKILKVWNVEGPQGVKTFFQAEWQLNLPNGDKVPAIMTAMIMDLKPYQYRLIMNCKKTELNNVLGDFWLMTATFLQDKN